MTEENSRRSKKTSSSETRWTPSTSRTEPKFTIGYVETVDLVPNSARKKLSWSERKKRNVSFTKLSNLSRNNLSRTSSPSKLNFAALNSKLTPQIQSVPDSPRRTLLATPEKAVSRNLFTDSPVKTKIDSLKFSESPVKARINSLKESVEEARKLEKKLTPAQVKAKLGNVKLKDLRDRLSSMEGSKLKAETGRKRLLESPRKTEMTLELTLPVSTPVQSPIKHVRTEIKASPRKIPAYQRYYNLSQPVNKTLGLPFTYSRLCEVFRSVDTVVSMMYNRQERITLTKLRKHVTDLMNRKFEVDKLRQIICVFPQSYNLTWRRNKSRPETRELVLEPNMHYKRDLREMFDEQQPEMNKSMTAAVLVERRDMFRNGLLDIVKDYHEDFLASLDPPITADRARLTKWHKDFNLDILPDIDLADLPPNPDCRADLEHVVKADHDYLNFTPKLSNVLLNINNLNKNAAEEDNVTIAPSPSKFLFSSVDKRNYFQSPSKTGLEGLNPELVARIKAKEAAKAKLEMTRSKEQIERIALLRKLPKLARLVK